MTHVRGQGVDQALLPVEGESVVATLLDPEIPVEPIVQRLGVRLQALGQGRVVPDLAGKTSGPDAGVIGVALDLTGRNRRFGYAAVGEEDRVPRILPALVDEAFLDRVLYSR